MLVEQLKSHFWMPWFIRSVSRKIYRKTQYLMGTFLVSCRKSIDWSPLVGGFNPSEKWWSSSVGIMKFPIWWEKYSIHVPNHQQCSPPMLKKHPIIQLIVADRISIILTSWTFFGLHAVSCNHMWPYLSILIFLYLFWTSIYWQKTLCTCIMRSLIGGAS